MHYKILKKLLMIYSNKLRLIFTLILGLFLLNSCGGKLPGADARKFPADPAKRVQQNLKEGKGFRIKDFGSNSGGTFEFASSNELWRASLDTIDFMPLVSANYSGGIIITDWYSQDQNEAIKITLRFLSNEIRSDAIDIKVFLKKCRIEENCKISESEGNLKKELKKQILKKAALYEKEKKEEDK
jgi:hypothetical protein